MPALSLSTNTATTTDGEEFTYTSAASETLRMWTQNCRVEIYRVLAVDWEDRQEARGHTPNEVYDFSSPAGSDWKFVVTPKRDSAGAVVPSAYIRLETFS